MKGVLKGSIEEIAFERPVELAPHSKQIVDFDQKNTPALHVEHPRLWWPNGYGAQDLYKLHLSFEMEGNLSDAQDVDFGVRKITYAVPGTDTLTISVNGVPIFIRGGNWGLDEALKRIPRERLEAEIRMHKLANLNLIRNWVGQSTSEDFYELCDKYGILLWDEFFQPNPADGPNPTDIETYVANVREKILRFRNHPSETGSVSVPTLESIHGMMPQKDWETITDDWAEHDMAKGAQRGDQYPGVLAARYGKIANLADFVRKAQLMNYEAFRAMYEGRNAQMFHPTTAVITWMSHPAQPSFVWQLYHYDLEPNSSLFAVRSAGEMVHIQFNEADGELQVINNLPQPLTDAVARVSIYLLDGTLASQYDTKVTAEPSSVTNLGEVKFPPRISSTHFLKLELRDAKGELISSNFYWRGEPGYPDLLTDLNELPKVTLEAKVERSISGGKQMVTVTLHNPTNSVALMAHLQLRDSSGERVLPVYYSDNYVSLVPNESISITIEAAQQDSMDKGATVVVDGWNVSVAPASAAGVSIAPNIDAQPEHWPVTGLPFQTVGLR